MRRFFFFLLVLGLGGVGLLRADVNVQAAQRGLKQAGFYFGDATGVYDSETAAAVTRFQIRSGLPITGKLDAATAKALGVASAKSAAAAPGPASGTWRRLRNGDMQFLKQVNSGAIPPPHSPGQVVAPQVAKAQMDPHGPPPPVEDASPVGRLPGSPVLAPSRTGLTERLRDYVGAFVLAGLDPQVGAELEFFADRVDYFGEQNVAREKIRRDLRRYDEQWPQRRFWLAGDLRVEEMERGIMKVTFPLRYELASGSRHASGEVMKTLKLRRTGTDDFEIVAVGERKAKDR